MMVLVFPTYFGYVVCAVDDMYDFLVVSTVVCLVANPKSVATFLGFER